MRRLARLCFSATLCAVSGPALAANGGFMILGLQETQAPASTPADVQPVPYARARGTQRRPYWTAAERRRARAGSRLARERLSSTRPTSSCFSSSPMEKRCDTALASGAPVSNGRASSGSAASRSGRTGRRRPRCFCAVPICRVIWRAALIIRSARGRSISGPRSTGFMAPTSRRRSGTTFRQVASE
jgi:hypothetical protein